MALERIASPKSTGGGGFTFEELIHASHLVRMLIGQYYPHCGLPYTDYHTIEAMQLQAGNAGFHTDDALLTVRKDDGTTGKVVVQVKSGIHFQESDRDFQSFCSDAWKDFTNVDAFDPMTDIIMLITGQLSLDEVNHVLCLNSWAEACTSGDAYIHKLTVTSKAKLKYLERFRKLLGNAAKTVITNDELWRFMKCVRIWNSDFENQDGRDQSSIFGLIQSYFNPLATESPKGFWTQLVVFVKRANETGMTIVPNMVSKDLHNCIRPMHAARDTLHPSIFKAALNRAEHAVKAYFNSNYGPELAIHLNNAVDGVRETMVRHEFQHIVQFYRGFYVPCGDGYDLSGGLEQLWKLMTLLHVAFPQWSWNEYPQSNVELIHQKRFVRMVYSLHKEKMAAVVLALAENVPIRISAFPYPIIIDNYQPKPSQSVCQKCGHTYEFRHILRNYCHPSQVGPFGEDENSLRMSETVLVTCSDCILNESEGCSSIEELRDFMVGVS